MVRHRTELLTVICAGLLLGGLRAQDREDPLLLIPNAAEVTASPEAAEKSLNDQAGRGYRLVSLREFQLWAPVGGVRSPDYRIVSEPVVQFETYAHVRDANARYVDRINQFAQEGFRVHPQAILNFGSGLWGTERGATVMERQPGGAMTCRYDVIHPRDTSEGAVVLPRGFVPLALPFRGILTESCEPTDATGSGSPTLRSVKSPFKWYESVEENDEQWVKRLASSAEEGCRLVGEWPAAGYVVLCEPGAAPRRVEYRLVRLPAKQRGMWTEPESPGDLAAAQALLSAASADGYCLAGGALRSGSPLVLEKRAPPSVNCEYRLVFAEGRRLIDMASRGLPKGFEPTWRASIPWGALLERRRPADDGAAGDGLVR